MEEKGGRGEGREGEGGEGGEGGREREGEGGREREGEEESKRERKGRREGVCVIIIRFLSLLYIYIHTQIKIITLNMHKCH